MSRTRTPLCRELADDTGGGPAPGIAGGSGEPPTLVVAGMPRAVDTPASRPSPLGADVPTMLRPIPGAGAALKRVEDLILGSVALVLLSPLMALIALLIKLDSVGPALFCQDRRGRGGEVICVYKFRTMRPQHGKGFRQASRGDPRVTRIGAFLRRTSLDELPQLFNVLQGTMSLVGPRPHPLALDEEFAPVIPALGSRYAVKPGITGWAQINGFRGETRRLDAMAGRIEHDLHYVRHWSPWLDLRILAVTAFRGWVHDNAY